MQVRFTRLVAFVLASLSIATLSVIAITSPSPQMARADEPLLKVGKAHPEESYPVYDGKKPIFFLVLGSDSRSKQWSTIQHGHADVIELVGLNPVKGKATILGFPRDSWVNIPGHGNNKINDALAFGGPAGIVSQVESLTGIHIDYYAISSFWHFRNLVHDVGGVDVQIPYAMNDHYSKAHFKKGKAHLGGRDALAFARDRHDPPGGDFGRSFNCGSLLISLLADYQKDFARSPARMLDWFGASLKYVATDIPRDELMKLAFYASAMSPKRVNNFVVPGTIGMEGPESVVHISPSANAMYNDLKQDGYIGK
ncbi:MAG: LCP family protein [Actinobacteria bacterium]|nr:LCP family protein [Actinomycetota bacterium]